MTEKAPSTGALRRQIIILFAVLYAAAATLCAFNVIGHSQGSTKAIEGILKTYDLKNEGSLTLDQYGKEHPILNTLFGSPIRHELKLPSQEESAKALSDDVLTFLKQVRKESSVAAWWSWFLINLSLLYVLTIVAMERSISTRPVIFALNTVALGCFIVGILAPAMVIWTAPIIPLESGNLNFVVQYQVRGIAAIIWDLLTGGHWIIGGFLLLFSIVTPMTKVSLTYFVTWSHSKSLNHKIGEFLHTIGKWSMADVFVAAVLLALYALKFQQATKSIPCLGLYYFIGYCLLSLSTTEVLTRSGLVAGHSERKAKGQLGLGLLNGLFAGFLCFAAGTSIYTYQQYTANIKQHMHPSPTPGKLNNADLVLPVHKAQGGQGN